MESKSAVHKVRRGEIYYCDLGSNDGSIQNGFRPVLIIQCDKGNDASTTTVVAAITTVDKKRYLPSHVFLEDRFGLKKPSMVMLEQLKTVNQADLENYIGVIDDPQITKQLNIGLKKALGLWKDRAPDPNKTLCLCPKCLSEYMENNRFLIRRVDPFCKIKHQCSQCAGSGYEYEVSEKSPCQKKGGVN